MRAHITVFLLDDYEFVRRGVADLLDAEDDIRVIGEAATTVTPWLEGASSMGSCGANESSNPGGSSSTSGTAGAHMPTASTTTTYE